MASVLFLLLLKNMVLAIPLSIHSHTFLVDVADTPKKREQGLMYVTDLPTKNGMLFVFNESNYHAFWMRNTFISLDIIWINDARKIITIYPNATPLSEIPIRPHEPAKYTLEINGGLSESLGFKRGDHVQFNLPQN